MTHNKVTIYHNPACGTSRNTLAMIQASGVEPEVIEYLKSPPTRSCLLELIDAMGIAPRDLLREKGTPYIELGLDDLTLADEVLIDAMLQYPILMNRPMVVTAKGVSYVVRQSWCWRYWKIQVVLLLLKKMVKWLIIHSNKPLKLARLSATITLDVQE